MASPSNRSTDPQKLPNNCRSRAVCTPVIPSSLINDLNNQKVKYSIASAHRQSPGTVAVGEPIAAAAANDRGTSIEIKSPTYFPILQNPRSTHL